MHAALAALLAFVGYVIGTAQVLLVDWVRARGEHARQLRLMRAELRHVATFKDKFDLKPDVFPLSDYTPRPPNISEAFIPTVAATNFSITDEIRDDNSQEALLGVADACNMMSRIYDRFEEQLDEAGHAADAEKMLQARERAWAFTAEYDRQLDRHLFAVLDAVRDLDRRIEEAALSRQFRRVGRRLPEGTNPPPLVPGDARLNAPAGGRGGGQTRLDWAGSRHL